MQRAVRVLEHVLDRQALLNRAIACRTFERCTAKLDLTGPLAMQSADRTRQRALGHG